MKRLKYIAAALIFPILIAGLMAGSSPAARAQANAESSNLATFVALTQYIRSQPTPSDVNSARIQVLAQFDGLFVDIYAEGFIAPFTGETAAEAKARIESVPTEDRYAAAMVESYRLAPDPFLLDIIHILLAQHYVGYFTAGDLAGANEFLGKSEIQRLADAFDYTDYTVSAPSATPGANRPPPSTRTAADVESANLATFVALTQYIRSQPTPTDVNAARIPVLAQFDGLFVDIYVEGFIAPFTGETAAEAKARIESVPTEDRYAAAMVESYRLASDPFLLDIIHILLAQHYVGYFTTSDLAGANEFLGKSEIQSLSDGFDAGDYAIPAPSATTPPATATPTPIPASPQAQPPHVMLRVVLVTEDWMPFASTDGWTQAVTPKESEALKYYEAAIWEETDSVHLYEFPNDYDPLVGLRIGNQTLTDAEKIAYREQFTIKKHAEMPEAYTLERSLFLRRAFEDFAALLVSRHPNSEHHLMYSGHGGPGGNLFESQLAHRDAGAFLQSWTSSLGQPLGVIDMGGPCAKGGFDDLANFCRYTRYYVASDINNGGYTMDDWTYEKHRETDPEAQYHRLFASNDELENALIDRIDLRRKDYEYSRNNMVSRSVEQGNYLYSCAEFSTFRSAFAEFLGQPSVNRSCRDLHQFLVANGAEPDLIEGFERVFVHRADNRDFFEWEVVANGMISPLGHIDY